MANNNNTHGLHENKTKIFTADKTDFIYIYKNIKHIKTEFLYNVWSDHKILSAIIMIGEKEVRGQNYWKLNTDILNDEQYRTEMTDYINEQKTFKSQYENVIEWWEMTKTYIKMYTKK